jgi:hypothetical protein
MSQEIKPGAGWVYLVPVDPARLEKSEGHQFGTKARTAKTFTLQWRCVAVGPSLPVPCAAGLIVPPSFYKAGGVYILSRDDDSLRNSWVEEHIVWGGERVARILVQYVAGDGWAGTPMFVVSEDD